MESEILILSESDVIDLSCECSTECSQCYNCPVDGDCCEQY